MGFFEKDDDGGFGCSFLIFVFYVFCVIKLDFDWWYCIEQFYLVVLEVDSCSKVGFNDVVFIV